MQPSPGWSPRDNQRWTALFQRFDIFHRLYSEHEKHQRWPALFQKEQEKNQRIFRENQLGISAIQRWIS